MKNKLKLKPADWLGITVLLILIICVRLFESRLFYDPFLQFFKTQLTKDFPGYDLGRLFLNYVFRYLLNTVFSLGILWLLFKDRDVIKLTSILYIAVFVVLGTLLFIVLSTSEPSQTLIFYLRRFLIQPLLLLLFVPAFYYQRYMK
ncbi:exosortase F system-associated membrane protein [Flavobacterium psychrotrophum]|uniref:exosortase F system-associated membrane protein n=1 Tax=Flavobacterium psychrotrophum TaxID=2294119 RepID=UPI000E317DC5|nr:exosortase F system-associated protein [Flavobacterium psychrotrophum]